MDFFDVIGLLGGLALFLFGMQTMATGLEKIAGNKLESTLRKLTSNPVLAVIFGALLTAAIQSSSASTVMVVGLVNSGMMQLSQAIGVIMGANIGTTVTAQILSLGDIESDNFFLLLLKPSTIAPVFACIGAFLFMFSESPKKRDIGQALVGFGVLFTGMFTMEDAVRPLRESELFVELFSSLENPILGVIAGALVTAAIQSSSASVGILQALASTGIISWSAAIPIILGQNIGTCITPMLASIGASKTAKRSAFSHLYFNVIGTTVFMIAIYGSRYIIGEFTFWDDVIDRSGIANFHTAFNVLVTLLFLPFTKSLARLATFTVKDKGESQATPGSGVPILDERILASPVVAIQKAQDTVAYMSKLSMENFSNAMTIINERDGDLKLKIDSIEETMDGLEVAVSNFLLKASHDELSVEESNTVSLLLSTISDIERIGDHCVNISNHSKNITKKGFSQNARNELQVLYEAVYENLNNINTALKTNNITVAYSVEPLEETVDVICEKLRERHIKRLKNAKCKLENGVIFVEILSDIERISDHCSNIANRVIYLNSGKADYDFHDMKKQFKNSRNSAAMAEILAGYEEKYLTRI